MSYENPYEAPQTADLRSEYGRGDSDLAGRGTRLAAAFVDGIIGAVCNLPFVYYSGLLDYVLNQEPIPLDLMVMTAVVGFVIFILVHGYFLHLNGQTLGKRMLGIRIANLDGSVPSFGRVIGLRYLPVAVIANVPVLGNIVPLIDVLFIFRGDRRCIHDLIAETKVVIA